MKWWLFRKRFWLDLREGTHFCKVLWGQNCVSLEILDWNWVKVISPIQRLLQSFRMEHGESVSWPMIGNPCLSLVLDFHGLLLSCDNILAQSYSNSSGAIFMRKQLGSYSTRWKLGWGFSTHAYTANSWVVHSSRLSVFNFLCFYCFQFSDQILGLDPSWGLLFHDREK